MRAPRLRLYPLQFHCQIVVVCFSDGVRVDDGWAVGFWLAILDLRCVRGLLRRGVRQDFCVDRCWCGCGVACDFDHGLVGNGDHDSGLRDFGVTEL